jgi:hypothetical protein
MYKNYLKLIIVSWIVTCFLGCTQYVRPTSSEYLGTERVFDKNYEIGQKLSAYVGQPIIKVKAYKVDRYKSNYMRASDDFIISGGIVTITGNKNTDYSVIGETTIGKETYAVVKRRNIGVLIKSDGSVHNKVLNIGSKVIMLYTFSVSPHDLKFYTSKGEKRIVDADYINYELIYGGTDGKSLTITYREYTKKDLARPAFYQNLVYQLGQSKIRFKDNVVEVHEATNEKIVYTVISDGLN